MSYNAELKKNFLFSCSLFCLLSNAWWHAFYVGTIRKILLSRYTWWTPTVILSSRLPRMLVCAYLGGPHTYDLTDRHESTDRVYAVQPTVILDLSLQRGILIKSIDKWICLLVECCPCIIQATTKVLPLSTHTSVTVRLHTCTHVLENPMSLVSTWHGSSNYSAVLDDMPAASQVVSQSRETRLPMHDNNHTRHT